MARRKTDPKDIRNPEHYFNRYVALEVKRNESEQAKFESKTVSLEELLTGGEEGLSREARTLLTDAGRTDGMEDGHIRRSLLAWIDYIENPELHKAIIELGNKEKVILTLRFHLCFTQREIAELFHLTQQSISKQESRILKKIRNAIEKENKRTGTGKP